MTPAIYLSLDLELDRPNEADEAIIQIGYVIGDINTGQILKEVSLFVKRPDEQSLLPFIVELTGITDDKLLNEGVTLESAYAILKADMEKYKPYKQMVQWGDGDCRCLFNHLGGPDDWPFYRRYIDVKTLNICRSITYNKSLRGGLGTAMKTHGLKFQGEQHDGLNDARATWQVFVKIMRELKRGVTANENRKGN